MAPIHETDVAEERSARAQWEHYELWEKVVVRARRKRGLWIGATVLVFFGLSAVPIVLERLPHWRAIEASRVLAQEVSKMKREAAADQHAYRIRFAGQGSLSFRVEKSANCFEPSGAVVREGTLMASAHAEKFSLLSPTRGKEIGIPGLSETFCYDPLEGSSVEWSNQEQMAGFGIIPRQDIEVPGSAVNELTIRRDRLSVLLLNGQSAEISFE